MERLLISVDNINYWLINMNRKSSGKIDNITPILIISTSRIHIYIDTARSADCLNKKLTIIQIQKSRLLYGSRL